MPVLAGRKEREGRGFIVDSRGRGDGCRAGPVGGKAIFCREKRKKSGVESWCSQGRRKSGVRACAKGDITLFLTCLGREKRKAVVQRPRYRVQGERESRNSCDLHENADVPVTKKRGKGGGERGTSSGPKVLGKKKKSAPRTTMRKNAFLKVNSGKKKETKTDGA